MHFSASRFWLGLTLGFVGVGAVVVAVALLSETSMWSAQASELISRRTAWTAQEGRVVLSTEFEARRDRLVPAHPSVGAPLTGR